MISLHRLLFSHVERCLSFPFFLLLSFLTISGFQYIHQIVQAPPLFIEFQISFSFQLLTMGFVCLFVCFAMVITKSCRRTPFTNKAFHLKFNLCYKLHSYLWSHVIFVWKLHEGRACFAGKTLRGDLRRKSLFPFPNSTQWWCFTLETLPTRVGQCAVDEAGCRSQGEIAAVRKGLRKKWD